MAFKLAEAYLELNTRGFSGVSSSIREINSRFDQMGSKISSVTSMLPSIGSVLAAAGFAGGIGGLLSLSAQAESTAISFEVMLGSADRAQKMIGEFRNFAASTPFSFDGLSRAGQTLLGFGVDAANVVDDIKMISNVAAGDANKLNSLALVFGQISAAGRLTGGDLLQLINTGFNPLQQIGEKTGESMAELKKRMEQGGVSFAEVRQAFVDATSAGGRFYQMNERQSQSLMGLISTLRDGVTENLRKIGDELVSGLNFKEVTAQATSFVNQFAVVFIPTVQFAVQTVASLAGTIYEWRDTLIVLVPVIGGVVIAMTALAAIQRTIVASQILIQALSGPKAWIALAGGIAIATGVTSQVLRALDQVKVEAPSTATKVDQLAGAIDNLNSSSRGLSMSNVAQQMEDSAKVVGSVFDRLQRQIDELSGRSAREMEVEDFLRSGGDSSYLPTLATMMDERDRLKEEKKDAEDRAANADKLRGVIQETPLEAFLAQQQHAMQLMSSGDLSVSEYDKIKDALRSRFLGNDDAESQISRDIEESRRAWESGLITAEERDSRVQMAEQRRRRDQGPVGVSQSAPQASFVSLADLGSRIQLAAFRKSEDYQKATAENTGKMLAALEKPRNMIATAG